MLADQINWSSSNLAQFADTVSMLQQRSNSLDIIEHTRVPSYPTGSSVLNVVVLGAIVGAALAGGLVLIIEYLDDTIKIPEQAFSPLNIWIPAQLA